MTEINTSFDLLARTTEIVAAYVSRNQLTQEKLFEFIQKVHHSLINITSGHSLKSPSSIGPAVPIESSITPDYLVCLEDGVHLKMLKRHLNTTYNMTPADYRKRWDLPANYPMVAPNYAKRRSAIAKAIGLGVNRKTQKKRVIHSL